MAAAQAISVIGAGSLRCGASVLAGIFNSPLHPKTTLTLCDLHDEALDLFDRLARTFAAAKESEIGIRATPDVADALDDADVVILCFGLGPQTAELSVWHGECNAEHDERRDALARAVLLNRTFEAVNEQMFRLDEPRVVNMVRPVEHSSQLLACPAFHLDWPPALPDEQRVPTAHQALRWVRADESAAMELHNRKDNTMTDALTAPASAAENRFNTKALAGWLEELEAGAPGCRTRLLRF